MRRKFGTPPRSSMCGLTAPKIRLARERDGAGTATTHSPAHARCTCSSTAATAILPSLIVLLRYLFFVLLRHLVDQNVRIEHADVNDSVILARDNEHRLVVFVEPHQVRILDHLQAGQEVLLACAAERHTRKAAAGMSLWRLVHFRTSTVTTSASSTSIARIGCIVSGANCRRHWSLLAS